MVYRSILKYPDSLQDLLIRLLTTPVPGNERLNTYAATENFVLGYDQDWLTAHSRPTDALIVPSLRGIHVIAT